MEMYLFLLLVVVQTLLIMRMWNLQVRVNHIQQHLETHLHYFPYNEKPYYKPYEKK